MRMFPRKLRSYTPAIKSIALLMASLFLYTVFLPGADLMAQTFRRFDDGSRSRLDQKVDRASRLENEQSWSNYVELGIAHERAEWEQEAYEEVQKQLDEIQTADKTDEEKQDEAKQVLGRFEASRDAWQDEAEQMFLEERGKFRAQNEAVSVGQIDANQYEALIATAEAAVAADSSLGLDGWENAIAAEHGAIQQSFEDELTAELDRARAANANLNAAEQAAFEDELARVEEELRAEFQVRDNFYIVRARNRYIAVLRNDDLNARLASEQAGAEAVGESLIAATEEELAQETEDRLAAAVTSTEEALEGAGSVDLNDVGNNWETEIEAVIDAGLRKWEAAEEDLYKRRLVWQEENKRTREEADAIWKSNHEKIKTSRDEWLQQVEQQITEGRAQWQEKIAEFDRNREKAERELAEHIQQQKEAWDASSKELSSIITGGGSALLEAKDSYRYYETLLEVASPESRGRDAELYAFYESERNYMAGAVGRFQRILAEAEGVVQEQMHSGENHTGLLNDVRLFAGDIPDTVAAIDEADFRAELSAEMESRGEDFLLYRRDLDDLAARNEVFVDRATELRDSGEFDYNGAATLEAMTTLVASVDRKYDEHRGELQAILNKDRTDLADDAARLAAIKTEIATWLGDSSQENKRLKKQTMAYFNDGLGGYYLTGNQGDPYLMTRAEYEWELLRRERNYLAKKLQRAEAVKSYADRAYQHDAGLEMASVTAERAAIAQVHADLKELEYHLIRGDIALNAPVDPQTEFDRIIAERDINVPDVAERKTRLELEISTLASIADFSGQPNAADIEALIKTIDEDYFGLRRMTVEERDNHPLYITRGKLAEFRARLEAGGNAAEITDRWTAVSGGARVIKEELESLHADYDFDGLAESIANVKTRMTERTLPDMQADIAQKKAEVEANAQMLAQAKDDLERAKKAYREARIDFDILRAANAEDLIRIDLNNTTSALAGVLNSMSKIEDIPGMEGRLWDPVSKGQLEYINEVSKRESAQQDLAYSGEVLSELEGLEESKKRLKAMEDLLGANDLSTLEPDAIADVFINKESELVDRASSTEAYRSQTEVLNAMDALKQAKTAFGDAETALDEARTDGKPAEEIELLRANVAIVRESIYASSEALIAAVRAEEQGRRDAVFHLLGENGTGEGLAEDLKKKTEAVNDRVKDQIFSLAEAGAVRLESFLTANEGKTFAELLQTVNDTLAATSLAIDTSRDGYGNVKDQASVRAEWKIVRGWIAQNKNLIDYANKAPADSDGRSIDDKWTAVLQQVENQAEDADYYQEFQDQVPDSSGHVWVSDYRTNREDLRARLQTVLADADPGAAYLALTGDDRELLTRYGVFDPATPDASLNAMRKAIDTDLAALDNGYKQIYLREEGAKHARELQAIQTELAGVGRRLNEAQQEKTALLQEKKTAAAGLIAAIDTRIAELDAIITPLRPVVEDLNDRARVASTYMKEMQQPGSSSALLGLASAEMQPFQAESALITAGLKRVLQLDEKRREEPAVSSADQVKAVIGFYRTDEAGEILRDENNVALISQEFLDKGLSDPAVNLLDVIGGNQSGPDLMLWAERLSDWTGEKRNREKASPELIAAVSLLDDSIRGVIAAREIIAHRNDNGGALKAQARDDAELLQKRQEKLARIRGLETSLAEAVRSAEQNQQDPVQAALAILENPDNITTLLLFDGYDENGEPDGVTDPEARDRVLELKRLAGRLRAARLNTTITTAGAKYAEIKGQYIASLAQNPLVVEPGREAFLNAYPQLKGERFIDDVANLPAAEFRAKVLEFLRTPPANSSLFVGEIIGHLSASTAEDDALKGEVVSLLNDFQDTIQASINVNLDPIDQVTLRDRDLRVRTNVNDLITAWSTRADDVRTALAADVDAIDPAASLTANQVAMGQKINGLLSDPALAGVREELVPLVNDATDSADLKSKLQNHLNNLTNPTSADLAELRQQLTVNDLRQAIMVADATTEFNAADYSDELREFIAVRAYAKAQERYAGYQEQKSADTAAVRDSASLNLSGLNGDFANWILTQDFDDFAATRSTADLIAEGDAVRTMNDYLGEYFQARGTAPEAIPDGGARVAERLALTEYQRMQDAASAAGGLHRLDEREYFGEFQGYLFLARVSDYLARNPVTLTAPSINDRAAEFRVHFEALLDDATYQGADGKTLRERMLIGDRREAFFQMAFNTIEYGGTLNQQLPPVLGEHRLNGTLNLPPPPADDFLPDTLTNIADYENKDYRALAAAVSPETAAALARIETIEQSMGENLSLSLSDAELARVVDRAGYGSAAPALRTELIALVKSHNLRARAGQATTADQAVATLRQNRVIEHFFPTPADQENLEIFMTGRGDVVVQVEAKYLEALKESHADLQQIARENRGAFFRAVIERSRGATTAFYDALPAEQQTRLNDFSTRLFDELTADQKNALTNNAADFERVFDLRSGQQLVASGIFENVEGEIMGALLRGADDATLSFARENPAALVTAFIEQIYTAEGLQPAVGASSATFLGSTPGLADLVTKAASDMDPALRDMLKSQRVLVERFLNQFQESDAERRELTEIFNDPARLNPDAALAADYSVRRAANLQNNENLQLGRAVLKIADAHERYFEQLGKQYAEDQFVAGKLAEFAELRGDDPNFKSNRFSNYRTYIDVEKPYQRGDYDKYVADINYANSQEADPAKHDTPKGFIEYHNGQMLNASSLNQDSPEDLFNGDWESVLLSDDPAAGSTVELGRETAVTTDDSEVFMKTVKSVSTLDRRNAVGAAFGSDAEIRHTYYENLANNYLEAVSQLNGTLSAVLRAADMADRRESDKGTAADIVAEVKAAYDPNAAAGVNDLSAIRDLKLDADSRLAEHTSQKISELQGSVLGIQGNFNKSAREFAGSGRRRQMSTMEQVDFLRNTFEAVRDDFHAAEANVTALSDTAERQRLEMSDLQRNHVDKLNFMAETWREFTFRNDEKETRQAVQEYAETPYLFSATADAPDSEQAATLEDYRGDAKEEYELALAAYDAAQDRLKDASFNVQTQDNLADFNTIVAGIEGGQTYAELDADERKTLQDLQDRKYRAHETLDAAEETELAALYHRDLYQKYKDLITARADHIKHTMRMIRVHKASELVNAEIQRRRIAAEEKKRQFEEALAQKFYVDSTEEDILAARDAVYKRLAVGVEAGVTNFYNEYKSWYWGAGTWAQDIGGTLKGQLEAGQFTQPRITPNQILEGLSGHLGASLMPTSDRGAVAKFLGAGGQIAEFGNFQGIYYAFLNQIGERDKANLENRITKAIMQPLAVNALAYIVAGQALASAGQALVAGIFTAPLGLAMIATGTALTYANYPLQQMAIREMAKSEAKFQMQQLFMAVLGMNAHNVSTGESAAEVWRKQKEYMDAQAHLEYFTKVPDMEEMKERMIQYGRSHRDDPNDHPFGATPAGPVRPYPIPDLYKLTDEDLKYLFDRPNGTDAEYITAAGATQTLSAEEKNESLDVSSNKRTVKYYDSFGTRYDPTTLRPDAPARMEGGFYYYNGDTTQWVRVKTSDHDDSVKYEYARVKAESDADDRAYDTGDVFKKLVAHGQGLRDDRRDAYMAAGNVHANAQTFMLNERDNTFQTLFGQAGTHTEGGREFTGYGMTYEDYVANSQQVADTRLGQTEELQKKEWDLRRQELVDRYQSWEKRLATILKRGKESWAGSEDRYLQKWRQWERDLDQEERDGRKKWDERIAAHFTKKQEWETELRAKASEKTIEIEMGKAVDQLNAQLAVAEQNLNMDLGRKNKIAMVNEAVADMRRGLLQGGAKLKSINKNIKNFNSNVSIASSIGGDFSRAVRGVATSFRGEMKEHQQKMKVMNKVKIFEEYRKMLEQFKIQIDVQNQRIEDQTRNAALAAGYIRQGDVYIKKGGASNAIGVVNAYKWYDVDREVNQKLADSGYSDKRGSDLIDFLKNKSDVEVESYFYVQKLALQGVMEYVQGTGSQAEREDSRDVKTIGAFAYWHGKGPDGEKAALATKAGGATLDRLSGGMGSKIMKYGIYGGYGELGSSGTRPGGAPLGFYPQLELMGEMVAKADAKGLASAGGTLDPISATLNAFNPVAMMANIARDVEVGERVHGHRRGNMIGGAVMKAAKPVLKVAVNALAAVVAAGGTILTAGAGGPVAIAAGAAIAVAGNALVDSIQVAEGGQVSIKSNAQVWTNALISGATTALTAGAGSFFEAGTTALKVAHAASNTIGEIAKAGFNFDERGRQKGGWSISKKAGDNLLFNTAVGVAGSALGNAMGGGFDGLGKGLMTSFGSTLASNTMTYGRCQAGNKGACAQYDSIQRPGAEALGALANSLGAGSALGNMIGESLYTEGKVKALAKQQNEQNKNKRLKQIMEAQALNRRKRSFGMNLLVGAGDYFGVGESIGNWMETGNFETNIQRAQGQQIGEIQAQFADMGSKLDKSIKNPTPRQTEILAQLKNPAVGHELKSKILAEFQKLEFEKPQIKSNTGATTVIARLQALGVKIKAADWEWAVGKLGGRSKQVSSKDIDGVFKQLAKKYNVDPNQKVDQAKFAKYFQQNVRAGTAYDQNWRELKKQKYSNDQIRRLLAGAKDVGVPAGIYTKVKPTTVSQPDRLIIKDDLLGKSGALGWLDRKLGTNLAGGAKKLYEGDNIVSKFVRDKDMTRGEAAKKYDAARQSVSDAATWTKYRFENMDPMNASMDLMRMAGGAFQTWAGAALISSGAAATGTGLGAFAGIPAMAAGAFMVANGTADIAAGGYNLYQNFMGKNGNRLGGNFEEIYKAGTGKENAPMWVQGVDVAAGLVGSFSGIGRGIARGAMAAGRGVANAGRAVASGAKVAYGGAKIAVGGMKTALNVGGQALSSFGAKMAGLTYYGVKGAANLARRSFNASVRAGKFVGGKIADAYRATRNKTRDLWNAARQKNHELGELYAQKVAQAGAAAWTAAKPTIARGLRAGRSSLTFSKGEVAMGVVGGTTNMLGNMGTNRQSNWFNNVTAFGSGFAFGVIGSRAGSRVEMGGSRWGNTWRAGVGGMIADAGAQGAEMIYNYGTGGEVKFSGTRMLINGGMGTAAGVAISARDVQLRGIAGGFGIMGSMLASGVSGVMDNEGPYPAWEMFKRMTTPN